MLAAYCVLHDEACLQTLDIIVVSPLDQVCLHTHCFAPYDTQESTVDLWRALPREPRTTLRLNMVLRLNTRVIQAMCCLELALRFVLWTDLGVNHYQHAQVSWRSHMSSNCDRILAENYDNMI